MQLTQQQLALLKRYQAYRHTSPTFLGVIRQTRRWPLALLIVCLAFGLVAIRPQASPRYGWFLVGFIGGAVYMAMTSLLRSVRLWPLIREVTDWKRLDELVRENENTGVNL